MNNYVDNEQYGWFRGQFGSQGAIERKYESVCGVYTHQSLPLAFEGDIKATLLVKIWSSKNRDLRVYLLGEDGILYSFVAQRNFHWFKDLLKAPLLSSLNLKFKKSKNNTYYCVELNKVNEKLI